MPFNAPIFDRPIPLTFDRVADNAPITSQTLIFQFPLELVASIVQYLSPADLASLALVDRDCRQLSRSIQLSRVVLDLDHAKGKGGMGLLETLEAEEGTCPRTTRTRSGSVVSTTSTHSRRLGPCVRHLRVAHRTRHALPITNPASQLMGPADILEDGTLSRVQAICASSAGVLPNLITLDWDAPFHHDTFHSLSSTMKHMRINVSKFDPETRDIPTLPSSTDAHSALALETLIIDVTNASKTRPEAVLPILQSTSNTLRTLVWRNLDRQLLPIPVEVLTFVVSLPALQQLHLEGITLDVPESPSTLTRPTLSPPAKLRDLSIEGCTGNVYEYLGLIGPISNLRSLRLASHPYLHSTLAARHVFGPEDLGSLCKLLENNNHVQALDISQPIPSVAVFHPTVPSVLPILASGFTDLRMLKLVFDASPSDEALATIAGMGSLEVLWLSAGSQGGHVGWCSEWEVDHARVVEALSRPSTSSNTSAFVDLSVAAADSSSSYFLPYSSPSTSYATVSKPLSNLRTLIFTRDTYTTTPPNTPRHPLEDPRARHLESRRYYKERKLPVGVWPEDWMSEEECLELLGGYSAPSSSSSSGSGSSTPSRGDEGGSGEVGGAAMCLGILPEVVSMPFDYEGTLRELEPVAWERWHADRMRRVAEGYFGSVGCGALEKVYVGMVPVLLGGGGGRGERDVDGSWAESVWRSGVRGL